MKKIFFSASAWPSIAIFWILLRGPELDLIYCSAAALLYTVIYFLLAFQDKETSKLDYAVMLYYITGLVLTLINDQIGRIILVKNSTFFLFTNLFLAATVPLMLGSEPFTMTFARKKAPEELWETDLFTKINNIMTLVWAGIFITGALLSLMPGGIWTRIVVPLALIPIIGFPFTKKFPDLYLKHSGIQ